MAAEFLAEGRLVGLSIDQQDAARAAEDLANCGLVNALPNGRYEIHPMVQAFAATKFEAEPDTERAVLMERLGQHFSMTLGREQWQEPQIMRDHWTLEDRLSYRSASSSVIAKPGRRSRSGSRRAGARAKRR
jgi:hypothetical protein